MLPAGTANEWLANTLAPDGAEVKTGAWSGLVSVTATSRVVESAVVVGDRDRVGLHHRLLRRKEGERRVGRAEGPVHRAGWPPVVSSAGASVALNVPI